MDLAGRPSTSAAAFKPAAPDAPSPTSPALQAGSYSSVSPPPSSPNPSSTRTKRRRNASTPNACCRTCRLRKVKCTGNAGNGDGCTSCARLGYVCVFGTENEAAGELGGDKVARTMPSRSHTEAGTIRKRAQRACSQCHTHKTKCSGDLPKCKRCETSDLDCEYTPAKRRFTNVQFNLNAASDDRDPLLVSPSQSDDMTPESVPAPVLASVSALVGQVSTQSQPQTAIHSPSTPATFEFSNFAGEVLLIRKDVLQTHMTAYYQHLYHLPCYGFFHPARTRRELQEDRFHPGLAAAVCSVTSWIVSPGEAGRNFARKCNEQVELHIFRNMGNLSELSLTLLTLANLYNWIDGQYAKMWVYSAQAARLVHALQFNWDSESPSGPDGFIDQEIRRRLTWQTYMTDRLLSGGYMEHTLCADKSMFLRLPCDEQSFQENRPVEMERLDQKPGVGPKGSGSSLCAYHIRIASIRHQILGATKKYVSNTEGNPHQSRLEPSQVMGDVNKLQLKISGLVETLPMSMRLSDQSIQAYFTSTERPSFIMLHTWIGQLYIDLYRFSLPDTQEQASPELLRKVPPDFITKSQKQAVAHAISLSRFWGHMFRLLVSSSTSPPLISTDYMVSVSILVVSQILLIARKHALFTNLNENSTAPLWRNGYVDDEVMDQLIKSNLEVLRPLAELVPRVRILETELLKKVQEFSRWRDNEKGTVGIRPVADSSISNRLPGPHYMLENAVFMETHEHARPTLYRDQWAEKAVVQAMAIFPPEKQMEFSEGRPGLPLLLAQARGLDSLPQPYMDRTAAHYHDNRHMDRIVPLPNYSNTVPQPQARHSRPQPPEVGPGSSLSLEALPFNRDMYGM